MAARITKAQIGGKRQGVMSNSHGVSCEETSLGLTMCVPKYAVNCLVTTGGLPDLCASGSDPVSRNLAINGFSALRCTSVWGKFSSNFYFTPMYSPALQTRVPPKVLEP